MADNLTGKRVVLDLGGSRIAVHRCGAGPAVVCMHAIGHGARDFERLSAQLKPQYDIIAIDWPGHGGSLPDDKPVDASHYCQLLAETMDALEVPSAYLLGNSIGGAVAMLYAASHPQRVQGLILCNPAGLQPVGLVARLVCSHMARFFGRGVKGSARFPAQFRRYYERDVLPSLPAKWRRDEIIASARQSAPILQQAWKGFARPDADLRDLPPKLSCPVLLAWAKKDKYISWGRSKDAARGFSNSVIQLFDGGHSAFLEAPELFITALQSFIETASQSAGAPAGALKIRGLA